MRIYPLGLTATPTSIADLIAVAIPAGEAPAWVPSCGLGGCVRVRLVAPGASVAITDPYTGQAISCPATGDYALEGPGAMSMLLDLGGAGTVMCIVEFLTK
jgi:hypothetical protein